MTHGGASSHETEARERFDSWSKSLTFSRLKPWLSWVQRQALERLDWSGVSRVLDIGCGSGWAVGEAAHRLAGTGTAFGCDISLKMLGQRTAFSFPVNACFIASGAQSLPFSAHTFDAVLCTVAFHHFPNPQQALEEMRRVLRPGGQLAIADSCRDLSIGFWWWDRLHRWFEKGHVMYYRTDELISLSSRAGFEGGEIQVLEPTFAQSRKVFRKSALLVARKSS